MTSEFGLLPVSSIGSLPKPPQLLQREQAPLHEQDTAAMRSAQQAAVQEWLSAQEELGIDLLVDGEQYRRSMISYFLEGWGCASVDPDPVWVLDNLYSQRAVIEREPTAPCTLASEWYRWASTQTRRPLKPTITGPYTLRDWAFDRRFATRHDAVMALAEHVGEETRALVAAGARYIQIDEPAYVTRFDQPDELRLAVAAMERARAPAGSDVLVFSHMCYGAFEEVYPRMLDLPVDVFCLELAHVTPAMLAGLRREPFPRDRGVGFGVVDAMDPRVDSVAEIEQRIRLALDHFRPEQIWLNPDCGFQALPRAVAMGKLKNLVIAARNIRATLS